MILFIILSISLFIFTSIIITNYFSSLNLKSAFNPISGGMVSILIPARNEEQNIAACLLGAASQTFNNFEIIILDDHSSDITYKIALSFAIDNPKITVVKGHPLPDGWTGKNWACHQLASLAKGDYLLFLDADVIISKETVSSALHHLNRNNLGLLTIFSTQILNSFGEKLVVPIMNWFLLTTLPLKLVSSRIKAFAAANGQFMLWRSEVYRKIGGHRQVSNHIVEDMGLIRLLKNTDSRSAVLLGGGIVKCRMYRSFNEGIVGFSKSLYPGFNATASVYLTIILLLVFVFISPFFLWIYSPVFLYLVPVVLAGRLLISIMSRQNIVLNLLLHPVQIFIFLYIGFNSFFLIRKNKLTWKGRQL